MMIIIYSSLIFGFMLTTALISMLLSNTATTVMMVQIVKVILTEIERTSEMTSNPALLAATEETTFQNVNIQSDPAEIVYDLSPSNDDNCTRGVLSAQQQMWVLRISLSVSKRASYTII